MFKSLKVQEVQGGKAAKVQEVQQIQKDKGGIYDEEAADYLPTVEDVPQIDITEEDHD